MRRTIPVRQNSGVEGEDIPNKGPILEAALCRHEVSTIRTTTNAAYRLRTNTNLRRLLKHHHHIAWREARTYAELSAERSA